MKNRLPEMEDDFQILFVLSPNRGPKLIPINQHPLVIHVRADLYRNYLDPSGLQRAVRAVAKLAKIDITVSHHTFLHCFATHILEVGFDIRTC